MLAEYKEQKRQRDSELEAEEREQKQQKQAAADADRRQKATDEAAARVAAELPALALPCLRPRTVGG